MVWGDWCITTRDKTTFEIKEINGFKVGYDLVFSNLDGLYLKLAFYNATNNDVVVNPEVYIYDYSGMAVNPYTFNSFVHLASSMASVPVPAMPADNANQYYSSGFVRNVTNGNTYSYSGVSTAAPMNVAGSFASGYARGAAIRAANERDAGFSMLKWANAEWLKTSYVLPASKGAFGGLAIPGDYVSRLPFSIIIKANGSSYEFKTKGPAQ